MKQVFLLITLLVVNFSYIEVNGSKSKSDAYPEICGTKSLINQGKGLLKPDYIYDGFKLIRVKLKDKPQVKTLLFPVNSEIDFKYAFTGSAMPDGTEIRIFNAKTPSQESLKFRKEFANESDQLSFETTKDMWAALIEIKIPAAEEGITSGCICVLAGYRL